MKINRYLLAFLFGSVLIPAPLLAQAVVATIPVGRSPRPIAVSPDGKRAYVGNAASGTVSVIDLVERKVIDTVTVGRGVRGIAVTPDGSRIFAANSGTNDVSVIDSRNYKVIAAIQAMLRPLGLVVEPKGKHEWADTPRLFVVQSGGRSVSLVDSRSLEVRDNIPVGVNPFTAALSPDQKTLYVSNTFTGDVSIIDATRYMGAMSNRLLGTVPVGLAPHGIGVTPDGKKVFVNNSGDLSVTVIDAEKRAVITTLPLASEEGKSKLERSDEGTFSIVGLALTPDGKWVLSAMGSLDALGVINAATLKVEEPIKVGKKPYWVAVSPDGRMAYVTNSGSNDVSVVELGRKFASAR
ncbi:MAG: beta-propeller fold lactonase family protein [Deltaproteobacteria bacterium]|nr:beta-propeller fold lactonase family protein [Deltaproteobacteria bacterium]